MPDTTPTSALMAALQERAQNDTPGPLPEYLGKATSVVVTDGPRLVFVQSADIAGHTLDIDYPVLVGLLHSIETLVGGELAAAQTADRERIIELEEEVSVLKAGGA